VEGFIPPGIAIFIILVFVPIITNFLLREIFAIVAFS
jgi:hypothetical protein